MIPNLRNKYNSEFTEEKYKRFLDDNWEITNGEEDFRICETPLFIDDSLNEKLLKASDEILTSLKSEEFRKNADNGLPSKYRITNETKNPLFLQLDFGICKDDSGEFVPRLIELQGFASLYMYQSYLSRKIKKHFSINESLTSFYNDFDHDSFEDFFAKTILGNSAPENVILLEINPHLQKTKIDFYLTQQKTGLKIVDVRDLILKGSTLFYKDDEKETPVERIYNRLIFDELERKNIELNFDIRSDINVEWVGHPNWFFKISKNSLPMIKSNFAPKCYYLDQLDKYPDDLKNFVLKPLYSFAGTGVQIDIDKTILDSIKDRNNYILQEKVEYAPIIDTPEGYSKAEIRLMFIWDDEPVLVNNLLRTGRGKMMGVDFNKGLTWIGASISFHKK